MRILSIIAATVIAATSAYGQTLEEARNQLDKENYLRAKIMLRTMLNEATSDKNQVAYYLGNTYLKMDDADSAKICYRILGAENKSAVGYLAQGRLALLSGDKAKAKDLFEKAAVTSKLKNSEVLYQIGDAWYKPTTTDLNEAIRNFTDAYKLDNKHYVNMLALGDALLDNGQGGEAMSKYRSAADINPKQTLAFIKMGRLNNRAKIYPDAVDAYTKALALEPDYAVAHWELGETYYLSKQYDKAKPEFKKYVELNKEDAEAKHKFVSFLYNLGEYEQCAAEAVRLMEEEPNDYILMRAVALSNYKLKRYKDGLDYAKRFWMAAPTNKVKAIDYITTAQLAAQNKDTATAMKYINTAMQMDSNNAELLGDYAKLMYDSKRYYDAIANYSKKIAKAGSTFNDLYYMGRSKYSIAVAMNKKKDDQMSKDSAAIYFVGADSIFAQITVKYPTVPDGWLYRAKCNNNLDPEMKAGAAKPFYESFLKLGEADAARYKNSLIEAYDNLGAYYLSQKDTGTARGYLNKALELDPNDAFTKELMKGL